MGELKPCPFCGGEAEVQNDWSDIGKYYWVACTECSANTKDYEYNQDEAIETWNRRAE